MTVSQRWRPILFGIIALVMVGCSSPEKEWDAATRENTASGYEAYLQRHPNNQFSAQARERLESIAWEEALTMGTAEGYEAFLERYPSSGHASAAQVNVELVESLAIDVVRHGIVSASCGQAEAVVVDIRAQRPGARVQFSSKNVRARQMTGESVPLQRFVVLRRRNVRMDDVAIRACFEDPDGLRLGPDTSADLAAGQNHWAFFPDATYFTMGLARMEAFIVYGSSGVVGFRDHRFFGRGDNAAKRPEESVAVELDTAGTIRTMLLFRPYELSAPAGSAPRLVELHAFGRTMKIDNVTR